MAKKTLEEAIKEAAAKGLRAPKKPKKVTRKKKK
jgi:hypothetical protein